MASQVSPGVVVNEFDFSDYTERISTAICGMVGASNRGLTNTITLITNERQLIETFGYPQTPVAAGTPPSDDAEATQTTGFILPAIHYLREGNQLQAVRVDGTSTATATTIMVNFSASTALTFTATSPGVWPMSTDRDVTFAIEDGTTATNNQIDGTGYFKLIIYEKGVAKETFDNVTNDRVGDTNNYPEARINGVSNYVTVEGHATNKNPLNTSGIIVSSGGGGGTNGVNPTPAVEDFYHDIDKTKGIGLFEDVDTVDINLLCAPGANDEVGDLNKTIVDGLVSVAELRGDTLALLDSRMADHTSVATARNFINGTGDFSSAATTNSSYAAYYWPWVKVFDGYSGTQTYVPPSGLVAGVMARNDRVAESWFAPAGFRRGLLKNVSRVARNTTLGEREQLYSAGEVVNAIVNFSGIGITVWGQKTTQRNATALNRVNVRRMLNVAKKIIATSVKFLTFEPNDATTWRRFVQIVTPPLASIKSRRGMYDFKVICDESTNPPEQIDRNEMRGIILMKPTKTAEIITIDFTLLSTGAQFNEFLDG